MINVKRATVNECVVFFIKQKTAYEMRISDWSSDVCSSDLDAEAVHEATREAVERARAGGGPTLIEAKTYRFGEHAHSLAIPISYRSEEELNHYKTERDPVTLYRAVLVARGLDADVATIEADVARKIGRAHV